MDQLTNDELWALSPKVIPLKIIGQCLQLFSLPVLILWVHTYVSILCRNLHQKVQSEYVFLPILRRDPETSSHTRQERDSESLLLSHIPAEMQPNPVSTEGDSNGWRECWKGISSSRRINIIVVIERCCCCSVAQSCLTLYKPTYCSTPGFPVLHCLLESAQTHVHWVSDAIQPSHPLLPPYLPALSLS